MKTKIYEKTQQERWEGIVFDGTNEEEIWKFINTDAYTDPNNSSSQLIMSVSDSRTVYWSKNLTVGDLGEPKKEVVNEKVIFIRSYSIKTGYTNTLSLYRGETLLKPIDIWYKRNSNFVVLRDGEEGRYTVSDEQEYSKRLTDLQCKSFLRKWFLDSDFHIETVLPYITDEIRDWFFDYLNKEKADGTSNLLMNRVADLKLLGYHDIQIDTLISNWAVKKCDNDDLKEAEELEVVNPDSSLEDLVITKRL